MQFLLTAILAHRHIMQFLLTAILTHKYIVPCLLTATLTLCAHDAILINCYLTLSSEVGLVLAFVLNMTFCSVTFLALAITAITDPVLIFDLEFTFLTMDHC